MTYLQTKTFRPQWDGRLYVSIPRYHPN